ncbi:MAG: hypothetical protein VX438_08665, partial [Planctomycetota bacterium]|nr:hypothetical protein [Planctomycetota bacterium]
LILTVKQQITDDKQGVSWKSISVTDDPGNRAAGISSGFTTTTDDPGSRFQAPADGVYRILVKDQFGTSGSKLPSAYWISVRQAKPDFRVVCQPVYGRPANGNQILASALTLRRGGRTHVNFNIEKIDGFDSPVTVTSEDLPAGVHCQPITISKNQSSGDLVFHAKEDAPTGRSIVKVFGKSVVGGKEVKRTAFYASVTWGTANKGQTPAYFRRTTDLELSVMPHEVAAVTVQAGSEQVFKTSLGGKIQLPIKLTRRLNYTEPLKLVARNLPGQIKPKDITIAKDKNDGTVEIFVKDKNTPIGTYAFCFKGDAKFKYSRNPEAALLAETEHKRLDALHKETTEKKKLLAPNVGKDAQAKEQSIALEAKLKLIDAARKAAKSQMDNLKKQSAAKDLFYMAVSNPVILTVVPSPIEILPVEAKPGVAKSQWSQIIKIQRNFGFADAITLNAKGPKGFGFKPVTLPKDATEIPLGIEIQENCPVGEHSIEIAATAKFNGVDVASKIKFNLKITAKPDAAGVSQ